MKKDYKNIVLKIIAGDIKAFEGLFNEYYERLAYYAYQFVRNKDGAEDIVQELFTKLWANKEHLGNEINIQAYLYRAVKNACLNQIKHQKVKEGFFLDTTFSEAIDDYIPNKIDSDELKIHIEISIFELPPERQKIFLLSREEGLKYHEIAEKLGISIKTVEAQMGKALRFLKEQLKDYLVLCIAFFNIF